MTEQCHLRLLAGESRNEIMSDLQSDIHIHLEEPSLTRRVLQSPLALLAGFIAIMWLLEIIDWAIFHGSLDRFGIVPRHIAGLRGIVLAPLLHDGYAHLVANTVPLFVLGALVISRHVKHFLAIAAIITAVSGLGIWLIAPAGSIHIGASGLIFGFVGFLLANAWYERSGVAVLLAVVVVALYGGVLWGVLPQGNGISWQGHLFGLVGGVLAAYFFSERRELA